jgi:hypothetical protein
MIKIEKASLFVNIHIYIYIYYLSSILDQLWKILLPLVWTCQKKKKKKLWKIPQYDVRGEAQTTTHAVS